MNEDIKKDISFEELRKIRRWTNTVEIYDFPFLTWVRIWVRVLTQDEIFKSTIFWKKQAEELDMKDDTWVIINFTTREILRKACFVWESDVKFFKSVDELWELSVDETDALFDLYNRTQERYAPTQSLETEKDFKDLISEIKKKSVRGMSLSSYTLEKLVFFLTAEWVKLPKGNGIGSGQWKKNKESLKKNLWTKEPVIEMKVN